MATGPRYSVQYKRKRTNKTNYKKRLALLKSGEVRLVVRKTNTRIIAQLVKFKPKGDETIINYSSKDLKSYGLNNINNLPAAYLTGYLLGKTALKNKIKKAVLDTGLLICSKGNKVFAVLAGAVSAGLNVPHKEDLFPTNERIKGAHIKEFDNSIIEKIKKNIDEKVK